jgi:integrase
MSAATVSTLCQRVRPELACLGDAGVPLVDLLGVVERAGAGRDRGVLEDPGFALDVLTAAGPHADPALVGRVLDFLRTRDGTSYQGSASRAASYRQVTVAEAVASHEAGPLAMMAKGTGRTYRTWTRRLAEAHPDEDVRDVTAGDLRDLVARHVLARRNQEVNRRRPACSAEEHAVAAYRHLWNYCVQKGWAAENVAMDLHKPTRPDPNRRDIRPGEAALVRQLAISTGRDPLLDEVTLTIPERLGLRNVEVLRLRMCDLDRRLLLVWGKNDKERTMPLPPGLADLLERYVEDRCPASVRLDEWLASDETLLRRPPAGKFPLGRPTGRRRIEQLYERLRPLAPEVFARGDICLHSYRHAVGTYVDDHYGRAVTRAVLGHTSKRSATDAYVHVSIEKMAEALCAYEQHVLAAEPLNGQRSDGDGRTPDEEISLARIPTAAVRSAESNARASLQVGDPGCRSMQFSPTVRPAEVTVEVSCVVDLSAATMLPVPGSVTVSARATQAVDRYRESSGEFGMPEGSGGANPNVGPVQ